MTPAQQQRVRELFEALVDGDPAGIEARLAAETPDDVDVRAEVLSLLDHHSRAGAFLESPPLLTRTETESLAAGTVLGPYTIVREVGRGGMGRVYLATDSRLHRQVCLKAVRTRGGDATYRRRLQREARTAASLTHPGICAVFALEEFDGELFLVTEYLDGRTLREEIDAGQVLTPAQLTETMRELADAVAAAHARGITHRDLKPENIMRSADGRLKILDFGVARVEPTIGGPATPGATLPGTLVGTLAYMAPEQLNGAAVGPPADVFALGVVIYELATGTHPFAAATGLGTAANIVGARPEPLGARRPDLPGSLVATVERCLAKRPEERFASAAEIGPALADSHRAHRPSPGRAWWRLHQSVAIGLYLVAAGAAWQAKEWEPSLATRWAFLMLGALAAVNGVVRGHLLFTDAANPARLAAERQRTRRLTTAIDVAIALLLLAGAGMVSQARPVMAVIVIGLAAGIAIAAVLIEPSTSRSALDVP